MNKFCLNWFAALSGQSGYELLTRGLLEALDKLGVTISFKNMEKWNREKILLSRDKTSRFERMGNTPPIEGAPYVVMQKFPVDVPRDFKGDIYIYSLFETDKIPQSWIPGFKRAKRVFTFSEFNRRHWSRQIDNVRRIGFGVDDCFRYEDAAANILNAKGYTFLSVGDYTERKGFDTLLQAYCEEFSARDDVTLILKVHKGGFTAPHKAFLVDEVGKVVKPYKNRPRVLLCMDKLNYDDMPRLYNACDCFVLATRGEGLGLPVAEAMARGLPVIVTDGGGHMDFVRAGENGLTVNSEQRTIESVEYIRKCPEALNHKWFVPDKADLKKKMREMYDGYADNTAATFIKNCYLGQTGQRQMFDMHWNDVAVRLLKEIFDAG